MAKLDHNSQEHMLCVRSWQPSLSGGFMAYPHFTDEEAENWKSLDTRIDSQGN